MSLFGQNGFRMELHPFNGVLFVAHAHDFAIFRPCRDFEAIRQAFSLDCQRMVPGYRYRIRQATENAFIFMKYGRGFSMHDLPGTDDFSTERRTDGLMTQTYSEKRDFSGEMCQDFKGDAGFIRGFRSRRYARYGQV